MMMLLSLVLALVLVVGAPGISQADLVVGAPRMSLADVYIPLRGAPDYVVTYPDTEKADSSAVTIVSHHGPWTRIGGDERDSGRIIHVRETQRVERWSSPKGREKATSLEVKWGGPDGPTPWRINGIRTNQMRVVAGESCTLYKHGLEQKSKLMSCMTEDGIEIATGFENYQGTLTMAEAVKVERRTVTLDEVAPDPRLFDSAYWLEKAGINTNVAGSSADSLSNVEATLMAVSVQLPFGRLDAAEHYRRYGASDSTLKLRFNGSWQRELRLDNRLSIAFERDARGEYRRLRIKQEKLFDRTLRDVRKKMDRAPENLFGESCIWYDMEPGMQDGGDAQCRTGDELVLGSEVWNVAIGQGKLTAVAVSRGTVRLVDILPPADLSDARGWERIGEQSPK